MPYNTPKRGLNFLATLTSCNSYVLNRFKNPTFRLNVLNVVLQKKMVFANNATEVSLFSKDYSN